MYDHKVALVTGGGSGIGRATSIAFARAGCAVVVADHCDAAGQETLDEITTAAEQTDTAGGAPDSVFVHTDVSSEADVQALMAEIRSRFGRLDYAVDNAGVEGVRAPLPDYPTDVFDAVMATNVRGVFLCLKHQIPLMSETASGHGSIVIMSSTAGVQGMPEFSAYSCSKHALLGLMRSAAGECARGGLRINCINPGTTDTSMVSRFSSAWPDWQAATNAAIPLGRIGSPQEIAEAAVWLCTKGTFMTGQSMVLDGGATCR